MDLASYAVGRAEMVGSHKWTDGIDGQDIEKDARSVDLVVRPLTALKNSDLVRLEMYNSVGDFVLRAREMMGKGLIYWHKCRRMKPARLSPKCMWSADDH